MGYLHIGLHKKRRDLRKYFPEKLNSGTRLVKIKDLGDHGLYNVMEGELGVVVVEKDGWVLQSAVVFLDVPENGERQKVLWDVYKRILDQIH